MDFFKKLNLAIANTKDFWKPITRIGKIKSFCFKASKVICEVAGWEKADEGMDLYGLYPGGEGNFVDILRLSWWLISDCHVGPLLCRVFGHHGEVFSREKCPEDLAGKEKTWCSQCYEANGPPRSY